MRSGYFQVPNYILEIEQLSSQQRLVLICMFRFGNQGQAIYPSYKKIAKCCSLCERKAKSTVMELESMGVLNVTRRKGSKGNQSNLYAINESALEKMRPSASCVNKESSAMIGADSNSTKQCAPDAQSGARHASTGVHDVHTKKNYSEKEQYKKSRSYPPDHMRNGANTRPTENYDHLAVNLFAD